MADSDQITVFYRTADGVISRATDDGALKQALADAGGLLWVDIVVREEPDVSVLRDVFGFHPLTIEDCLSPVVDPAKIDEYPNYIFVIVQAVTNFEAEGELKPVEVDFYLGTNFVVSCRREPVPAIDQFRERCRRDDNLLNHSADWILHGLLDALVDEYLPIVDAIDDTIDVLESEVLHHPDTRLLQRIMLIKRNALRLRRATIPQRDIMNRLSRGEFARFISDERAIYYRDIYDHLVRVEYLVEALRDLADGALNTYLSVVSNRLNEVMKVLTGATVIFLPGALIAGIYGTNFPAGHVWPPYSSEWGFAAVVLVIIFMIVAMLFYFRYRSWV